MTDRKRSTLSLPPKAAGEQSPSEGRNRPPVRGSHKPRAPRPFAAGQSPDSADGYSRRRDEEVPARRGAGPRAERSEGSRERRPRSNESGRNEGYRSPRPTDTRPRRDGSDTQRRGDDAPRSGDRRPPRDNERRQLFSGTGSTESASRYNNRPERGGPDSPRRSPGPRTERTPGESHGESRSRRSFESGTGDQGRYRPSDNRRSANGENRNINRHGNAGDNREGFRSERDSNRHERRGPSNRDNTAPSWETGRRTDGAAEGRTASRARGNFEGPSRFNEGRSRGAYQGQSNSTSSPRQNDRPRRTFRDDSQRPSARLNDSFRNDQRFDDRNEIGGGRFGNNTQVASGTSFGRTRSRDSSAAHEHVNRKPSTANTASPREQVDPEGAVRLSKRMAELGLCSRREADEYIERGLVKVDGLVVDELGSKVLPGQRIEMSAIAEDMQMRRITVLLNKPIGYVSGQAEDGYEPASVLITAENHWDEDPTKRRYESRIIRKLAPAGRLDIDSTGLLVLTQDGRIAKHLIGESSDVEKEYLVRVEGSLSAQGMALLNHGLELDGVELRPAKVSWQNEDQLRFVLREGRKRQIRRMCEQVGLRVVGLKRIRIGRVKLGKLPPGQWRYLAEGEEF